MIEDDEQHEDNEDDLNDARNKESLCDQNVESNNDKENTNDFFIDYVEHNNLIDLTKNIEHALITETEVTISDPICRPRSERE